MAFFTPLTITAKLLFQDRWKLGVDWNSELTDSTCDLQMWKIPRCLVVSAWVDAPNKQVDIFFVTYQKGDMAVALI